VIKPGRKALTRLFECSTVLADKPLQVDRLLRHDERVTRICGAKLMAFWGVVNACLIGFTALKKQSSDAQLKAYSA